ncbi:MAG: hypothetical protein ACJASR_002320 [Psychroserpens sp.]|jgi:hypothetical protein
MRKFVINIILFIVPILFLFILNEYYCRTQTTFSIKRKYLENNIKTIKVLILGSSHSQNGLNPEFVEEKSSNLAFGGQAISIDYFLLDKYIDQMNGLKTVIFEVSPFRFYNDHKIGQWNGHIYSNLYNINYKINSLSIKDYSLIISDPKFFNSIFIDYINPLTFKYKLNKYGFVTNDFNDRFEKLKYDSLEIIKSYIMQHDFTDKEIFKLNELFLKKIIQKCKSKKVDIVLLSTPVYISYYSKIPVNAKIEVNNMLNEYKLLFGITILDFSNDKSFSLYDFKNDNHLNSKGAEKLTRKIDSILVNKAHGGNKGYIQ